MKVDELIPGGAQLKSKQPWRFASNAPRTAVSANGCRVYDGKREYIDWTASCGTIIIGYGYAKKDSRVRDNTLPLPTIEEHMLAEKLVEIIPCAEMVRFAKNGSDVCSAAVELSKWVTGKDFVCSTGYHGWHRWENRLEVEYGDLLSLEYKFRQYDVACYILEPMDRSCPHLMNRQVLEKTKKLCKKYGVVLIFDEVLSGFRYAMGGIQELLGVAPDLACFGKAMSNGFSVSALVGKRSLMEEIVELPFSGTFFGEVLPIRAAIDCIDFMQRNNVIEAVKEKAKLFHPIIRQILNGVGISNNGDSWVYLKGGGPWSAFVWNRKREKGQRLFLEEITRNGILYSRDHFLMFAHSAKDIDCTLDIYADAFAKVKRLCC